MNTYPSDALWVSSEIGTLRRVLVHTPDSGLGKVIPSKAQDWLFEDIVQLDSLRRHEYDYYTKLLLYFLDPLKIQGKISQADNPDNKRNFYKPEHPDFFSSDKVVELQNLLSEILYEKEIKAILTASVCAIENCTYTTQKRLNQLAPPELAKVFITGSTPDKSMIFPPIPNFIFTRDIGIVIHDHILLNKPAKKARIREALLSKYIFYHHPVFSPWRQNIIELTDIPRHFLMPEDNKEEQVTLEGGDVMIVSRDHLLIGISERTTLEAAHQVIDILFEKKLVKKISLIKIPPRREYMHIDTIFTQVKRNVWILLGKFSKSSVHQENADPVEKILGTSKKEERLEIIQFNERDINHPVYMDNLEDLLLDVSVKDLKCSEKVHFIYSGNNEFPYDSREQWTDSCNLLALKEGVVLGYDRNDKTIEAFRQHGFGITRAEELLQKIEAGEVSPDQVEDTLILIPSAELSRARGGFHCMSMPLLRDEIIF